MRYLTYRGFRCVAERVNPGDVEVGQHSPEDVEGELPVTRSVEIVATEPGAEALQKKLAVLGRCAQIAAHADRAHANLAWYHALSKFQVAQDETVEHADGVGRQPRLAVGHVLPRHVAANVPKYVPVVEATCLGVFLF
ncbi:MAG TPA: hypothetical protein VMZ51_06200 [Acidimicrobiales bacterium]|nr:hypothetical protein [Acidimicrobiales bacterium]